MYGSLPILPERCFFIRRRIVVLKTDGGQVVSAVIRAGNKMAISPILVSGILEKLTKKMGLVAAAAAGPADFGYTSVNFEQNGCCAVHDWVVFSLSFLRFLPAPVHSVSRPWAFAGITAAHGHVEHFHAEGKGHAEIDIVF